MSVARVHRVKSARQRFQMVSTGETKDVTVRGKVQHRRVKVADKNQPLKNHSCSKCRVEIEVGQPYLYWEPGFRSSYKVVRCTKSECFPRTSELESSKVASIYSAIESVEDQLASITEVSDFEGLIDEVRSAVVEVKDEYEEASTGDSGQVWNTVAEERAQAMGEVESELDGFSLSNESPDPCDEHGMNNEECQACQTLSEEHLQACRDEVQELISGLSI